MYTAVVKSMKCLYTMAHIVWILPKTPQNFSVECDTTWALSYLKIDKNIESTRDLHYSPFGRGNPQYFTHKGSGMRRLFNTMGSPRLPKSKVHGANVGSTWVLSAIGGPQFGPKNLAIRNVYLTILLPVSPTSPLPHLFLINLVGASTRWCPVSLKRSNTNLV